MEFSRRHVLKVLGAAAVLTPLGLAGCTGSSGKSTKTSAGSTASTSSSGSTTVASLALDAKAWKYDSSNDVYYQLGQYYVTHPAAKDYENLAVYVPGKYFAASKNSDGTYTAKINRTGKVGSYTADTAPIVLPVNTPGYAAQKPPTSYSYNDVSDYLKAGFVYVAPGLRGRDVETSSYTGNAPWGVTDLKAAVRYVRYNAGVIPGHKDRIFVFGMSGGGGQSAVMGSTGDSTLYQPYLTALGAAMKGANGKALSDAIAGVMAWCPITSLDWGNAAYEWNMGQFASTGTRAAGTWTKAYSDDLATAFAGYVNDLALKDSSGTALTLSKSSSGQYLAGTYYDYLVSVIEGSLNDFLKVTTFPYTPSAGGGMAGGAPAGGTAGGGTSSGGSMPTGSKPTGTPPGGASGGGAATGTGSSSSSSTTYKTVAAYFAHLNSASTWVQYDSATKTAKVLNLEGFVNSQKAATKDVGAFDGITRQETENTVLGLGSTGLHFAPVSQKVIAAGASAYAKLTGWKASYAASTYTSDFAKTDTAKTTVSTRLKMYSPMYFLAKNQVGYKSAAVAPHWRIRTGIMQGDTANTTEVNLALALANLGKSVDFATIWGEAHTQAELTGSPTTNFISWVKKSLA